MTVKDILPVTILGISFIEDTTDVVFGWQEKLTSIEVLMGRNAPRDDGKQFHQPPNGVNCYYVQPGLVCLSAFCTDFKMISYFSILVLYWH